jgi:hypothetical protein
MPIFNVRYDIIANQKPFVNRNGRHKKYRHNIKSTIFLLYDTLKLWT